MPARPRLNRTDAGFVRAGVHAVAGMKRSGVGAWREGNKNLWIAVPCPIVASVGLGAGVDGRRVKAEKKHLVTKGAMFVG